MSQQGKFVQQEYVNVTVLLEKLLELDVESKEKIGNCIKSNGIGYFLDNFTEINLPESINEKLQALKGFMDDYDAVH